MGAANELLSASGIWGIWGMVKVGIDAAVNREEGEEGASASVSWVLVVSERRKFSRHASSLACAADFGRGTTPSLMSSLMAISSPLSTTSSSKR